MVHEVAAAQHVGPQPQVSQVRPRWLAGALRTVVAHSGDETRLHLGLRHTLSLGHCWSMSCLLTC